MRVTKELKTKISREFQEKMSVELMAINEKIVEERKIVAENFGILLHKIEELESGGLFIEAIDNWRYRTASNLSDFLADKTETKEIKKLEKEAQEIRKKYRLKEENFLIQITYSKNIEEIKGIFQENGLTF